MLFCDFLEVSALRQARCFYVVHSSGAALACTCKDDSAQSAVALLPWIGSAIDSVKKQAQSDAPGFYLMGLRLRATGLTKHALGDKVPQLPEREDVTFDIAAHIECNLFVCQRPTRSLQVICARTTLLLKVLHRKILYLVP